MPASRCPQTTHAELLRAGAGAAADGFARGGPLAVHPRAGRFVDAAAAERIAFEAVEDLAADNVRLAELRFSPEFLCEPHGLDWDAAMAAIVRGVERGSREFDVTVGLIAIASRNYGMASAERTAAFALRHRDHLVGFDLAGDEQAVSPVVVRRRGRRSRRLRPQAHDALRGVRALRVPSRGRRGPRLASARARRERGGGPGGRRARPRARGHARDVPDLEPPDARRRRPRRSSGAPAARPGRLGHDQHRQPRPVRDRPDQRARGLRRRARVLRRRPSPRDRERARRELRRQGAPRPTSGGGTSAGWTRRLSGAR